MTLALSLLSAAGSEMSDDMFEAALNVEADSLNAGYAEGLAQGKEQGALALALPPCPLSHAQGSKRADAPGKNTDIA